MSNNKFQCKYCGYTPREKPAFGSWYCPKCGKKNTFEVNRSRPRRAISYKKRSIEPKRSKDEIYDQIYTKLTVKEEKDLGYKARYINPSIKPIEPKKREKIRLFIKK